MAASAASTPGEAPQKGGIRKDGGFDLVVHFHGGLVKESVGVEVARKMAPVYRAAGAAPLTPDTSCMASPSKFPTQTPTV